MTTNSENQETKPGTAIAVYRWLKRLFTSMRLALYLMLVLTFLSITGALVTQVPGDLSAADYDYWLQNVAYAKYGLFGTFLNFFGFFDVFHSFLFVLAGSLLIINILVCSLNRWGASQASFARSRFLPEEESYTQGQFHTEIKSVPAASDRAADILEKAAKRHHYTVSRRESGGPVLLAGDKNRFSGLGTYAIHLSLLLFIAGFLIGSYFGFSDASFTVAEGTTGEVGHDTNLSLRLESFTDEYWPEGMPKDYRSEVILYANGQEVKRGTMRVNSPLGFGGIRFYQSYFGPAAQFRVSSDDGSVVYEGNVALSDTRTTHPYERPQGVLAIPGTQYVVALLGPASNYEDPLITPEQVAFELYDHTSSTPLTWSFLDPGVPYDFGGMEFTYVGPSQFSGFQVRRDPGNGLIWVASVLFLVGLSVVFYYPRRMMWALVQPVSKNSSHVLMRLNSTRGLSAEDDFKSFKNTLDSIKSGGGN